MSPQHRFSGPELGALLERVRQELGAEAQIHEANKVRSGGVAGFFASESFEVIASADGQTPANGRASDGRASDGRAPVETPPPPAATVRTASGRPAPDRIASGRPAPRVRRAPAARPEPREDAPQIIETAARSNHRPAGVAAGLLDRAEEVSVTERITGHPGRPEPVDLRITPAPRFDQVLAAEVHETGIGLDRDMNLDRDMDLDAGVDLDFRFDSGASTPATTREHTAKPSVDLTAESVAPPPPAPAPIITVPTATPSAAPGAHGSSLPASDTPAPPSPSAARFWTALSGVENQLSTDDPDRRLVFMGSLDAAMAAARTATQSATRSATQAATRSSATQSAIQSADVTATVLTPSTPPAGAAPWMCFADPAEISARLMWHDSQQHGETPAPIVIDLALAERVNPSLDRVRSHGPTTVHLAVTENLSVKEILSRFSTIGGKVVLDIVHEAPPAYVIGLIDHGIRVASVGGRRFDAGLALALRQSLNQSLNQPPSQQLSEPSRQSMRSPAPNRG